MSKRARELNEDEKPAKRPRPERQQAAIEEVHFARQLQNLLTFNQDGIQQLRHGIASFKVFLESILYHKDEDDRARQISILHEYLDAEKPADQNDVDRPILSQLWQAWSFANQNNIDSLASSISALLALLLKTLSEILGLREHGMLVCRSILLYQHLRLIKRCLDAPKDKDFLISPCLRLLTEVTCFDGGVFAREVYKRREQTFDVNSLRRNLSLAKPDQSEEDARRRPAIRTQTLRYVLSLLKYLHEGGKIDLLKSRVLCTALFQQLRDDPSEVVIELLTTLEQNVLKQDDLPRSTKAALLVQQNLERVREVTSRYLEGDGAAEKAFAWLKAVCTDPSYGVLRQSGWYPPGTSTYQQGDDYDSIDLGLDSLDFYDNGHPTQIRNTTLLSWLRTLRPHTDPQQRELLLTCFINAPELVAAYFSGREMQLDPKLTNTWIGHTSLLFEVIRLPVPAFLGNEDEWAQLPPQTSIMLDNILPTPLTPQIITRCLNNSSDLISFFAIRILILAFEKLSAIVHDLKSPRDTAIQPLWQEASQSLLQRFATSCPPMKDVISCFRKMKDGDDHALQREAIVRLLRLYYEVTPMLASDELFDISGALTSALLRNESLARSAPEDLRALRSLELEHQLTIARHSPGMRWFTKQGGLVFSPIVTLLRIHRNDVGNKQIKELLGHVLYEHTVLQPGKEDLTFTALDALVASTLGLSDDKTLWFFIDDCIGRATRKPVKYLDDLDKILLEADADQHTTTSIPSLLAAVLLEQAPFITSKQDGDGNAQMTWVNRFLLLLEQSSDNGDTLREVMTALRKTPGWQSEHLTNDDLAFVNICRKSTKQSATATQADTSANTKQIVSAESIIPSFTAFVEPESHPELTRWLQKDLDLAFEDGDIDALMLCLCSNHLSIRTQALQQLTNLRHQLLSNSTHENNSQLALLIGELAETYAQHYASRASSPPLPYLAGTFAVRALHVQLQPAHSVYPKLNKFLIRGAEWRVSRLPSYWLSSTILNLPDEDDAYWKEVLWVLEWLVDGLRTPADLEIMRRGAVFERVLALSTSPGAAARKRVGECVVELIVRATAVDRGSDVLVTRTGVLAWAEMVGGKVGKALKEKVLETCDREKTTAWAGTKMDL